MRVRVSVALAVVIVHAAAIVAVATDRDAMRHIGSGLSESLTVDLLTPSHSSDSISSSMLHESTIELVDLPNIDFEKVISAPTRIDVPREADGSPDHRIDPPHIDSSYAVDVQEYAKLAGLESGKRVEVRLYVVVDYDGLVSKVLVERGSGNVAIDSAAVDYARALRWSPGTIDGQSASMRAALTVVFTSAA